MPPTDESNPPDEEARRVYREVLEGVGEGALADEERVSLLDAFRIANKLDVSIAETRHERVYNYSTRDIEGLGKLERADWQELMAEWRKWHREYAALSPLGLVAWMVSAALAWALLYRADRVLEIASSLGVQPQTWMIKAAGWVLLFGVMVFTSRLIGTITSSAHWDTYSAGYSEGLRQGINKALMITPEREREMWDELSKASLAQSHLEYAATKAEAKPD